jgi:hypothetical protein
MDEGTIDEINRDTIRDISISFSKDLSVPVREREFTNAPKRKPLLTDCGMQGHNQTNIY